jgi:hypothetical protein
VALVSLAIASTGLCMSLSAGAAASCPVADAPERDACCNQEAGNEACPEAPAHPTCRMCDDTVAFLLKEDTDGAKVSLAPVALVAALGTVASATSSTSSCGGSCCGAPTCCAK